MLSPEAQRRWRLILGADSQTELGGQLDATDQARDQALDYLYQREYRGRGRHDTQPDGRGGGREPTALTPAHWLARVRQVFPRSVVDTLQRQAIDRYRLTALLGDPEVLRQATPSMELVQTLLTFRNHLPAPVMGEVRRIIRAVCAALERALAQTLRSRLAGRRLRHRHGGRPQLSHLDWPTTLRRNLKHYDLERQLPVLERLYFNRRQQQRIPWDLFLVVDQSASMMHAIIHSAVLAAIFSGLRSLRTHLILFDTSVVDLSGRLGDPVETLLAVQLGGGTDIGLALTYVAERLSQPTRSLVVLISDFEEGANPQVMFGQVQRMKEAGAALLGLAALDDEATPVYNEQIARQLSALGMDIAALTPDRLADWVVSRM